MRQENCIVDLLMYRIRELGFVLGKCERTCFQASSILAGQGQELITIFSQFFHEIYFRIELNIQYSDLR